MHDLRVTTVQSALCWEDVDANLQQFSEKLAPLAGQTDLIILPEMFTTGFSMRSAELAEDLPGRTIEWMRTTATALQAVLTGSMIAGDRGKYYNRLVWARPDGAYTTYDKRHLFTLAGEHLHFAAGTHRLLVEHRGWTICPLICYDLRFPVWSRNTVGFDLLIYVANWPERRRHAWTSLLPARAIENQCYTVGVNRVGDDGNGIHYAGLSTVVDYKGDLLYQVAEKEEIHTQSLSFEEQEAFRTQYAFLKDADEFQLRH